MTERMELALIRDYLAQAHALLSEAATSPVDALHHVRISELLELASTGIAIAGADDIPLFGSIEVVSGSTPVIDLTARIRARDAEAVVLSEESAKLILPIEPAQ